MSDERKIVLFALSTCPACKKTKDLLNSMGIDYVSADLDTVDIESRNRLLEKVREHNPKETFPTLVINAGEKVIVGYSKEEITEALGNTG
ncbi:MAG: glutaredoxin family protein [Nitrospirota bacterium]|nr:MAG: glutaredoxin family protein [Nitrospirota bacterium]